MVMKDTVYRLVIIHLVVLVLGVAGGFFLGSWTGVLAAGVGVLCFSVPVVSFSFLVLKASAGDQRRFWGRFMAAEFFKWVSAGVLLALAFVSRALPAQPLLAGFFLSVLVQVFFPIFVRKESQS